MRPRRGGAGHLHQQATRRPLVQLRQADPDAKYRSPHDYNGHASHVASTAARNHDVEAVINGVDLGTISGMAPASRLAMYKACWMDTNLAPRGCGLLEQIKGIDSANPAEGPAAGKGTVTVPAGTKVARLATYAPDVPAGTDLNLYVYRDGALAGRSLGLTAEEAFTATTADRYEVYVVQYATAEGVSEQDVGLNAFVVAPASAGNLTVTPASVAVTPGRQLELTDAWSGLGRAPGT